MPHSARRLPTLPLCSSALLGVFMLTLVSLAARAADPTFVGNVALLLDDETATRLELTGEQRTQLQQLAGRREDQALEMAIAARRIEATTGDISP